MVTNGKREGVGYGGEISGGVEGAGRGFEEVEVWGTEISRCG